MAWEPDYVSSVQLASYVRIPDLEDDLELSLAVSAASRAVDQACNRQFGRVETPEARTYVGAFDRGCTTWVLSVDDYYTVSGVGVEIDGEAVGDVSYEPLNAAQTGRPWTRVALDDRDFTASSTVQQVVVTAAWGWASVPTTIKQATLLQASRFFKRRNAPFGIAGSPDDNSEMRLLAKVDPDVAVMLRPYMRLRSVF